MFFVFLSVLTFAITFPYYPKLKFYGYSLLKRAMNNISALCLTSQILKKGKLLIVGLWNATAQIVLKTRSTQRGTKKLRTSLRWDRFVFTHVRRVQCQCHLVYRSMEIFYTKKVEFLFSVPFYCVDCCFFISKRCKYAQLFTSFHLIYSF